MVLVKHVVKSSTFYWHVFFFIPKKDTVIGYFLHDFRASFLSLWIKFDFDWKSINHFVAVFTFCLWLWNCSWFLTRFAVILKHLSHKRTENSIKEKTFRQTQLDKTIDHLILGNFCHSMWFMTVAFFSHFVFDFFRIVENAQI